MFVDKVLVKVKAGDGGDGIISFRREKFIDRGGPDGGDGGDGGDIIFEASRNQDTLASFRYKKRIEAQSGQAGSKRRKHGRSATDLVLLVPVGTVITDSSGELMADLAEDGTKVVVAHGGKGGYGNAHFVSSRRQAPRLAEKGEKGDLLEITLELKMLADVGLIGMPNAGKSTLLASVSGAHPEIANYPFTTLRPNLGMVDIDNETALLFADIPGLIKGASQGKGLGDEFLRHVERTKVLVHLIDIYEDNVGEAYQTIQDELKAYKTDLAKRPQVVALNKIDGVGEEIVADKISQLKSLVPKNNNVRAISAQSKVGVKELLFDVKKLVLGERKKEEKKALKKPNLGIPILRLANPDKWTVTKTEKGFSVSGHKIERFASRTDFGNYQSVQRLHDIMRKMGILHELSRQGIEPGQKIHIKGSGSIEY